MRCAFGGLPGLRSLGAVLSDVSHRGHAFHGDAASGTLSTSMAASAIIRPGALTIAVQVNFSTFYNLPFEPEKNYC